MPNGQASDNRQGWYVQAGYFLNGLNVPGVPDVINNYVHRFEPLVRYSGVNQHFVSIDDIKGATGIGLGGMQVGLVPDFGISGSPATYAPHSREVALGLDYWIAPSIVWQNEFDIELPHAGGLSSGYRRQDPGRFGTERPRLPKPIHGRILRGVTNMKKFLVALILAALAIGLAGARVSAQQQDNMSPAEHKRLFRDGAKLWPVYCNTVTTRGRARNSLPINGTRS